MPLPLSEIYPGLQQDLIDGAEGFASQHTSLKLFEVANNFTLTGHIWQLTGMAGGKFLLAKPSLRRCNGAMRSPSGCSCG